MLPLFKFKIEGNSMIPAFNPGDVILVNRLSYLLSKPKIGDIVVLKRGRYIIKRIAKIKKKKLFVAGDNKRESTDSRSFDWVDKKELVGKVMLKI